tara:strand:+ start:1915 stop:2184 length:270 start_codon:yes stop_codon:yes gene_type:complete
VWVGGIYPEFIMAKPKDKKRVSPEDFIKIWQTSLTTAEVMEKTDLKVHAARTRACMYRKKGIPLKYMTRGKKRLDVEALTKLAVEYGEG